MAVDVGAAKATNGNETVQYPADIKQGKCSVSCMSEIRSRCPCVAVDVGEEKATIGNETVQYPADIEQGKCSVSCLNLLPNGAVESFWDAMRLGPMVFMGRETTLHNM